MSFSVTSTGLSKRFRVAGVAKRVGGSPTKQVSPKLLLRSFLSCSSSNFLLLTKLKSSKVLVYFPSSLPVALTSSSPYINAWTCDDVFCKSTNYLNTDSSILDQAWKILNVLNHYTLNFIYIFIFLSSLFSCLINSTVLKLRYMLSCGKLSYMHLQ